MKIKQLLGYTADELEAMDDTVLYGHLKEGIEAITSYTSRSNNGKGKMVEKKEKKKKVASGASRLKGLSQTMLLDKLNKELAELEEEDDE